MKIFSFGLVLFFGISLNSQVKIKLTDELSQKPVPNLRVKVNKGKDYTSNGSGYITIEDLKRGDRIEIISNFEISLVNL